MDANKPQQPNASNTQQQPHVELPDIQHTKQFQSTAQETKKTASYTYWVTQNNKSRQLPPEQRPQKIDPPKLVTQKSDDGRSHWNTAGTWQHKNISMKEIEQQYTEKINLWLQQTSPQIKVKSVSLKGQCQLVFIRTKKALTYEINGKVELQKVTEEKQEKNNEVQDQVKEDEERRSGSLSLSDDNSEGSPSPKLTKIKTKSSTMTFEIVDLTDHGDRDFKSKGEKPEDKKWIGQKSQQLLVLLENIIKSYK